MALRRDADAIEQWIRTEHPDLLDATAAAAASVTATWPRCWTSESGMLVARLQAELAESGLLEAYAALLASLRDRLDLGHGPAIVPSPPYVVVTSRGPILRLTTADGRIVVRFDLFEVDRDDGIRYRRADRDEASLVTVEIR